MPTNPRVSSFVFLLLLCCLLGDGITAADRDLQFLVTGNDRAVITDGFSSVDSGFAVSTPSVIEPAPKPTWPDPAPVFLALDGIELGATVAGTLRASIFPNLIWLSWLSAQGPGSMSVGTVTLKEVIPADALERTNSYLAPRLKERWGGDAIIDSVDWGGTFRGDDKLTAYISEIKKAICRIRSANKDRPFVIIGHSWGSVVGYQALLALEQEPCKTGGPIDLFVTIGSPLGSELMKFVVKSLPNTVPGQRLLGTPRKPTTVTTWINIKVTTDPVAAKIPAADNNLQWNAGWKGEITPAPFAYYYAHSSYYENPKRAKALADTIKDSLPVRRSAGGGGGAGSWGESKRVFDAKVTKAKQDMRALEAALKFYKLDNYDYPSTEQGLEALIEKPTTPPEPAHWKAGEYVDRLPKDPWGSDYQYLSPGQNIAFDLYSLGSDGRVGGAGMTQDIYIEQRSSVKAKSISVIDALVSGAARLLISTEVRAKASCDEPGQIGIFNSVAGLVFYRSGVFFVTSDDNSYARLLDVMTVQCSKLLPRHYAMFGEAIALFEASDRIMTICGIGGEKRCIDAVFAFADVTGDGQLTVAEVARVARGLAFYLSSGVAQSSSPGRPVPYEGLYAGTAAVGLLGPVFAKGLIASIDFDGNGAASLDELLQDRGPDAMAGGLGTIASASTQVALKGIFEALARAMTIGLPAFIH